VFSMMISTSKFGQLDFFGLFYFLSISEFYTFLIGSAVRIFRDDNVNNNDEV
jgi:hypothetical protein